MKIALVCPRFYPLIGGVETVVLQLASHLAAMGNQVSVLTQTENSELARKEGLENFTVLRFPAIGPGVLKVSSSLLNFLHKNSDRYDIIHAHNYHSFPVIAVALTKKACVVLSPHYHGTGRTLPTRILHYPYRGVGRFLFSKSDAVICDTSAEATLIQKHFPNVKNITVIPLAIDVQGIQKAKKTNNKSNYILSVGRLENYKNVALIIESLQFLKNDISLVIVGEGSLLKQLKKTVHSHNLTKRVSFLGTVSNRELYVLIKSAKAYVTMSRMEAYGLSLLEAAASTIGIIASDIHAHRELISRFTIRNVQLLNPDSSPSVLAEAITKTMKNPSYAEKQLPTWELVTQQTFALYEDALRVK